MQFTKKPYDWQKKAFDLFKDAKAFMLNVCCGGGKTFAAIWIGLYKALPIIVIAPKALCDQWEEDLIDCGVAEKDIFVFSQPDYSRNKSRYVEEATQWLQR